MGKADLHIHTTASDGSCDPVDIVLLAKSKLLHTISITDHDTLDGYFGAVGPAKDSDINLIPGVEITTCHDQREIHILAYNFDPDSRLIHQLLIRQRKARLDRMKKIIHLLKENEGLDLDIEEVKALARSNSVGRPHLARLMVKKRMVASVAEAFIRYIGNTLIAKIRVEYASLEEVIRIVSKAGGITSLAHPGPLYSMKEIETYIDLGLDGIECIHPSHGYDEQKRFTALAEKRQLLMTGGSDFHGTGTEYDPYFGIVTLSERRVVDLRRMTQNRKKLQMNTGS